MGFLIILFNEFLQISYSCSGTCQTEVETNINANTVANSLPPAATWTRPNPFPGEREHRMSSSVRDSHRHRRTGKNGLARIGATEKERTEKRISLQR